MILKSLDIHSGKVSVKVFCRWASKTTNMFLPNEERYLFDGEKLTPEENEASIPDKPIFEGIEKVHHEILSPNLVADLVNNPGWNDIFITALAKDSVFGSTEYKIVNKNSNDSPKPLKMYYASTVYEWIESFNKTVFKLRDLENNEQPLIYYNKNINEIINNKYNNVNKATFYTNKNLHEFYQSFRAFRNSERNLSGQLNNSEPSNSLTFESISSFLLGTPEVKASSENFEVLLNFIESNIHYYSIDRLNQLIGLLIDNLHDSTLSSAQDKLALFKKFIEKNVFDHYSGIIEELSPAHLDKLAFLLTVSQDLPKAKEILTLLVNTYKTAPSKNTFNRFISSYDQNTSSKYTILKELAGLKPVFFHKTLSETSFKFLLHKIIDNVHDLEQLINLIETDVKSKKLLMTYTSEIINKLHSIQSSSQDSEIVKSVQTVQLIRRLVKNNNVSLDENSLEILRDMNLSNDNMQFLRPYIN